MNFGNVIKKGEDDYTVFVNLEKYGSGYNVVPTSVDPYNAYNIEEVKEYCEANPDKVYTKHPLEQQMETDAEIASLKQYLADTDYAVIKCQELGLDLDTEYPDLKTKREEARARINKLEAELAGLQ